MSNGYIAFVLHFHLPWVLGHGRWPHGEDWLNEAAAECYLPLLQTFSRLAEDGIGNCVTVGITPVLGEQLSSERFRKEFRAYIARKTESAARDIRHFEKEGESEMARLAAQWRDFFAGVGSYFTEHLGGDIMGAFHSLQEQGIIEIITSAATHGYLPLLAQDGAVKGQILTGVETYKRRYSKAPRGFWLPECAYRPGREKWSEPVGKVRRFRHRRGIEEFLSDAGIQYTLVDTHMVKGSEGRGPARWRMYHHGVSGDPFRTGTPDGLPPPLPRRGAPPPYHDGRSPYCPYELVGEGKRDGAGICVFIRDPRTGLQVWSGQWGYPGDGRYLEFHKKHWPGGHRYWRVTDSKADLGDKQIHKPRWADDAIASHVDHFVGLVREIVAQSGEFTGGAPPVIVSPFDAELFGHWWFEGPRWLEATLRRFAADSEVNPSTLGSYLDSFPPWERVTLPEGSWGEGGDDRVWLNRDTEWTWEKIYEAERRMAELVRRPPRADGDWRRVMSQFARELLLLEASDWQFLITTGTARDYAERRFSFHYSDAMKLADIAQSVLSDGTISGDDAAYLETLERRDSCFNAVDTDWWK